MPKSKATAVSLDAFQPIHVVPEQPKADIVTVTPATAKAWLDANTHNRNLRKAAVVNYARDMIAGNWQMNGEAIKFATDGTLLDGQHRLHAVVASNVSVLMLVITGLPTEAQATMDTGAKRTTGDALGLQGNKNATVLAAILRRVYMWERGDLKFSATYTPTTAECAALLEAKPQIHRSVEVAVQVHGAFPYLPQSITGTAHHLLSKVNGGDAVWFFARLGDGAQLPAGHPILTLRSKAVGERDERKVAQNWRQLAYIIRTWNAVREGRSLARIQQAPDAAMPMPK